MVGEDADVQHVRVGEDEVGAVADGAALLARRVAVVDRVAQEARPQLGQLSRLVLGERLGRIEIQGARASVGGERVEHRQVERERLAARRAGRDDRVPLARGGVCLGLVRVELLHAAFPQRVE